MTTTPVGETYVAPANPRVVDKSMTQGDFLNLLITQLANQDPLKPTDSDSMMTQMTQIASIQSMTALQQGMTTLGVDQQITLGQQLINKTVMLQDAQGNQVTGVVTQVSLDNTTTDTTGAPVTIVDLQINGTAYPIAGLESVLPDTPPATTPPTTP